MQILSIQTDDTRAIMSLQFDNGTQSELSYSRLRAACRCAECTALQRAGGVIVSSGVTLQTIQAVGSGALNLHFSDGHARGIYPLPYLIELSNAAIAV
ncbi:MAG: hypothetical protein JWN23_1253 [Rhodocyclales bacterium]|nr:hypothetical protein [Rhodocyclales bacterium]